MARTKNEETHAQKRKHILSAAEALFLKQGFHQTGMAAICQAAKMSPGTLYRYFPSKTDIIIAFVEDEVAETALWLDHLERAEDFRAALIESLVQVMTEVADPEYGQLAMDIAAEAGRNAQVGAAITEAESQAYRRLAVLIKTHATAPKSDPNTAARMLGLLIDGAVGAGDQLPTQKKLRSATEALVTALI